MKNKRYINVHLHLGEDIFNLGMVKIDGSMPAEKALEKVNRVLDRFGVDAQRDISGFTTDGASVMKKFGKLLNTTHQLCYAHGIHLAVCDVLYKSQPEAHDMAESTLSTAHGEEGAEEGMEDMEGRARGRNRKRQTTMTKSMLQKMPIMRMNMKL